MRVARRFPPFQDREEPALSGVEGVAQPHLEFGKGQPPQDPFAFTFHSHALNPFLKVLPVVSFGLQGGIFCDLSHLLICCPNPHFITRSCTRRWRWRSPC